MGSAIRHGETDALENAGRLPATTYRRSTMYTTLSPCDMCTGAILLYDIPRVVIGENRTFMGAEDLLRSRGVEVVVIDSDECTAMMTEFIDAEPALWNEDIGEPGCRPSSGYSSATIEPTRSASEGSRRTRTTE